MSELQVVSEKELNRCPECDNSLTHGSIEFLGEGLMIVPVNCENCDWHGTEEWVHDQTVV